MTSITKTSRKISCDFFRVSLGRDNQINFVDAINAIHRDKPKVEDRHVLNGEDYMRIHGWRVNGKDAEGALLRLRIRDNATVARLDIDDVQELELKPGEVLTEYFCFRYYAEMNILVVHRNRDAGNYKRLESYLMDLRPECKPAVLSAIAAPDAWGRMENLRTISIAEITVARPQSLAAFGGSGKSVTQMANLTQDSGAEFLTLRFSMGHTRRSLSDQIKGFFREAAGLGVVHSATVQGKSSYPVGRTSLQTDEITIIDLIADELRERVVVEIPDGKMHMTDVQHALSEAYNRRLPELYDQFNLSP